jgi:histone deacetylase 6
VYAFERLLLPIFRQYNPEMIFVSAGFDSACGDPLGGLGLSSAGYTYVTQQLMKINPKVIALLEGGYDLAIISMGALTVVKALLGQVAP